jgi:hypothetical protein
MTSLAIIVDRLRACWSNLQAVFTEWQHRIRSRYDVERLNERELAAMGMTRRMPSIRRKNTFGSRRVGTKTDLNLNDNDAGKPEGIHLEIGRRPRPAFGNSTGDRQKLEYRSRRWRTSDDAGVARRRAAGIRIWSRTRTA